MDLNPDYLMYTLPPTGKSTKRRGGAESGGKKPSRARRAKVRDSEVAPSSAPSSNPTPEIPLPVSFSTESGLPTSTSPTFPSSAPCSSQALPPSSAEVPSVVDKGKEVDPSASACPPSRTTSSVPRASPFKRGQFWDGDLPEELGAAFFPPRRFLRPQPLEDADRLEIQKVPCHLSKAFGLSQAYLHLHEFYVLASENARNQKLNFERADERARMFEKAKEAAEVERDNLKVELRNYQESAERARADFLMTHQALTQANADVMRVSSTLAELQTSHARSLDAVKSLTQQRSQLCGELEVVRADLTREKLAHEKAADTVRKAASDSFQMALAQIEYLNPDVKLNLAGYGCRSYFKGGVLIPPPTSSEEESVSVAEDDQGEQAGEEFVSGVEHEDVGTSGGTAAPPS